MTQISGEDTLDDLDIMDNFGQNTFFPLYSEDVWKVNEVTNLRKVMQNKSPCWNSSERIIQDDEELNTSLHTIESEQDITDEECDCDECIFPNKRKPIPCYYFNK